MAAKKGEYSIYIYVCIEHEASSNALKHTKWF